MHKLDIGRRPALVLTAMALALSSVTALSVAMKMAALIDDALLASVFAAAAVLLDLFKYLAWPIAFGLIAARRLGYAALMIGCALILGGVSAWATYDRLLTSIVTGQARQAAIVVQRMTDLQAVRGDSLRRLEALDEESRSIGEQARLLRERGIVTKAQDLEVTALPRIADQRERALVRLDVVSQELTELRSQPVAAAELPELLAILLCAGFAVALEVVPALILSVVRMDRAPAVAAPAAVVVAEQREEQPTAAAAAVAVEPEALVAVSTAGQQQELFGPQDDELFERLRGIARATPAGTPISLRDITAAFRVGNRRAQRLIRTALDLGLMRKTTAGYVAA
ncbi:hypothetical protein D3C78_505960 [compost metagenome]